MRAGSGVVVSRRYGNVCVQRGVQLRSEDDVADDADHTEQVQEKASVEEISLPLLTKMSSERTLAVPAALMQQPDKSTALLAWTLCLNVFGSGAYSNPARIRPECEHYSLTSDAPSGKEGAAFMALMAEKARLAALLPEGWARDMTTFLLLSRRYCYPCSVSAPHAASTAFRPVSVVTRHAVRLTRWKPLSDSTCATGGSRQKRTSSDT